MPTTDRILDWGTIRTAGIDTDHVDRVTNHGMPDLEQYAATRPGDPDFRLLFGEDPDEGWNTYLEEQDGDDWVSAGQSPDWYATPAEVLAAVKTWQNPPVATFTIVIEASDADETQWQALAPAEVYRGAPGESAQDVADSTAEHQDVATGPGAWRVLVFAGDLTGPEHSSPRAEDAAAVSYHGARTVLEQLNEYDGDNIWEEVILHLAYDEAATEAVGGTGEGRDVVIGGVHYRHEGGRWTVRD